MIVPCDDKEGKFKVGVRITILNIIEVDLKGEQIKLDAEIGLNWIDWEYRKHIGNERKRLQINRIVSFRMFIDPEFGKSVWIPDMSFGMIH